MEETNSFSDKSSSAVYKFQGENMNWNSSNVVYLECNVKNVACNILVVPAQNFVFLLATTIIATGNTVLGNLSCRVSFHFHFEMPDHNGMQDWSYTLIYEAQYPTVYEKRNTSKNIT